MVKSVASEQHCCLSVERPWDSSLYFATTLSHYSKQGSQRGPGSPREPFLSIWIPFLYPRKLKLGVAEVNLSPKIPSQFCHFWEEFFCLKLKIRSCRGEYISENSNLYNILHARSSPPVVVFLITNLTRL